jgi:cytochrome-b5 reductase
MMEESGEHPFRTRSLAMNHTVNLLMSQFVTHDVKRFIVSKPEGFSIVPGQGVELAINLPGLSEQGRPFTPTGLAADRVLEFTIKAYPAHAGVTQALHQLVPGAELLMSEPLAPSATRDPVFSLPVAPASRLFWPSCAGWHTGESWTTRP